MMLKRTACWAAAILLTLGRPLAAKACDTTLAAFFEADKGLELDLGRDFAELTNLPRVGPDCVNIAIQRRQGGKWQRLWRTDVTAISDVKTPDDALAKNAGYWSAFDDTSLSSIADPNSLSGFVLSAAAKGKTPQIILLIGAHGNATRAMEATEEPSRSESAVAQDGSRSMGSSARPLHSRGFGDEIRRIIAGLQKTQRLVGVGLDACQLASIETQYEVFVADATEAQLAASQENQDGPGWFHKAWPGGLGHGFGSAVVDHGPIAWKKWQEDRQQFGVLTGTDGAGLGAVAKAADSLGLALSVEPLPPYEAVAQIRCNCARFPHRHNTSDDGERLVDLTCLAEGIKGDSRFSPTTQTAAQTVVTAMAAAVKGRIKCAAPDNCPRGLSIFLPERRSDGSVSLSGYTPNIAQPPRFILRDGTPPTRGGWARWIDVWQKHAPRQCGSGF